MLKSATAAASSDVTLRLIILLTLAAASMHMLLPLMYYIPDSEAGIVLSSIQKAQFGTDVVYTYGPLIFLHKPYGLGSWSHWVLAVAYLVFLTGLKVFANIAVLSNLQVRWPMLAMAAAYFLFMGVTGDVLVLLFLISIDKFTERSRKLIIVVSVWFLAVESLTKFTEAIRALSLLVGFGLVAIVNGNRRNLRLSVFACGTYAALLLLLWRLAGQEIGGLPAFLRHSFDLMSAYSETMGLVGRTSHLVAALLTLSWLAFSTIASLLVRDRVYSSLTLISSGVCFLAFKHSFVRQDDHVYEFFGLSTTIAALYFLAPFLSTIPRSRLLQATRWGSLAACTYLAVAFGPFPKWNPDNYPRLGLLRWYSAMLVEPSLFVRESEAHKTLLREDFGLGQPVLDRLGGGTVDAFTVWTSLPYAYGLRWRPRPVPQSYVANTSDLDRLNAAHFATAVAPEFVLYDGWTLDGRCVLFDEPATFQALLKSYSFVEKAGRFLVLKRDLGKALRSNAEKALIGRTVARLGQYIPVPARRGEMIIGQIDVALSVRGRVRTFLFKPSPASIELSCWSNGSRSTHRFRFLRDSAHNGLILSSCPVGIDELRRIFQGDLDNDVSGFTIDADDPRDYAEWVHVTFYSLRPPSHDGADHHSPKPDAGERVPS